MKKIIVISRILALCFAFLFSIAGSAADTKRDLLKNRMDFYEVRESLAMDRKWVPYPEYSDREGWDNFFKDFRDQYIKEGENYLDYKYKMIPASAYLEFELNGANEAFYKPYTANKEALAHLLLAELAEGKGRFLDQIIDGIFALCHMNTWSSPVSNRGEGQSRGAMQPHDSHIIDIEAAQLGNMLSWIYYFFNKEFDNIDPEISRRLHHELQVRIMDPFFTVDSFEWTARRDNKKSAPGNIVPLVNSNVLVSFMLLENDKDKLAQAVYYTMQSVDKYLNQIKKGGSNEALNRSESAGKVLDYLEMLWLATGGKLDLSDESLIRKMRKLVARSGSTYIPSAPFAGADIFGILNDKKLHKY